MSAVHLLKSLWGKEILFITSSFSFSHSVFNPFGELSTSFIRSKIVVCKLFQLGKLKNLSFGLLSIFREKFAELGIEPATPWSKLLCTTHRASLALHSSFNLTLSQTTNFRLFQTKEFADYNSNFDTNGRKFSKCVENIVGKGEIAH